MAVAGEFRAFEPVGMNNGFDPPQLLECEVELILMS